MKKYENLYKYYKIIMYDKARIIFKQEFNCASYLMLYYIKFLEKYSEIIELRKKSNNTT